MLFRWIKSSGTLTINTMHVALHVRIFEFRLGCVALLVVLWYFVLCGIFVRMYHIKKTEEITSVPGDHSPSDH